jgi:hypothetical protein
MERTIKTRTLFYILALAVAFYTCYQAVQLGGHALGELLLTAKQDKQEQE